MLVDGNKPCDTDLFMLISTLGNKIKNYDEVLSILHASLKKAVKHKDFDFDIATLRMYKTEENENYLLLHTHVYGGARNAEVSVRYLRDADIILAEAMRSVLNAFHIKMDILLKQYIFYSQDLGEFDKFMKLNYPNYQIRTLYDSKVYLGDIIISVTKKSRKMTHKLGYLAFEIAEEYLFASKEDRKKRQALVERVIEKIKMIGPIFRAEIRRKYKRTIYFGLFIEISLILSFASFIYNYYYLYLNYTIGLIVLILVLISIIGMNSAYLAKISFGDNELVYK